MMRHLAHRLSLSVDSVTKISKVANVSIGAYVTKAGPSSSCLPNYSSTSLRATIPKAPFSGSTGTSQSRASTCSTTGIAAGRNFFVRQHATLGEMVSARNASTSTQASSSTPTNAAVLHAQPSRQQLKTLFVHSAVPFVAFGFVDNTVLIQAGDLIDNTFGVYFALPTLAAAAMGQVFSDTTGVLFGNTIEALATRLGLPVPDLTASQRMMRKTKLVSTAGAVIGVITGCCLGMVNLLIIDLGASERLRREAELKVTVFEMIMGQGHEIAECERSTLFLVDREKQELWSVHATSAGELPMLRLPLSKGIAGHVARTGELVRIDDVYEDDRFYSEIDKDTKFKTRCLLCAPVRNIDGEVLGVVQFLNKKSGFFSASDEKLILMLCQHVGIFMAKIGQN